MAEPIIGAGGVIVHPQDYFKEIREICDEHDILFVADEVITGFGGTGKRFGEEHWGVVPDRMTIAKGISRGYIRLGGGVMSNNSHQMLIAKTEGTLFHGYTDSGHPASTAVALKNIEISENENLVENSKNMGKELLKGLHQLEEELNVLGGNRSVCLLAAIEVYKNTEAKEHFDTKYAPLIVQEAANRGLICRAVTYDEADTVVLAPPLIINKEQITE